tara:strand:- start:913 stop:1257 length:345 start_codon:yes stop_codon:yes gene_type:complete
MSTPDHWSTEVLKELQQIRQSISTLDAKITDTKQSLQDEIHSIRAEILEFQLKTQQLDDVTAWANRFREKITLADVERLKADVDALKEYKAKSTVVFATVQFIMAGIVAWLTKG